MRRHLSVLFVFVAILAILIFVESRPGFPDADSFYHAKMAIMIRDHGFIHQLKWLAYTPLASSFVDYHLGYHILLIPFVTLFDPLVGMKVSAVLFALIAFAVLYAVLRFIKTPRPEIFVALAFLSGSFLFRMTLPRAPALSVAILLAFAWAMLSKRPWLITIFAVAYVWLYYGWPLLFVVLFAVTFADFFAQRFLNHGETMFQTMKCVMRQQARSVVQCVIGISIGLVINPYFPQNIFLTARDILKLAVLNTHGSVPIGNEWYPSTLGQFSMHTLPVVFAFVICIALFLSMEAQQKKTLSKKELHTFISVLILAFVFIFLTLKSNRFCEYAVPFLTLATGGLFFFSHDFIVHEIHKRVPDIRQQFRQSRVAKMLVALLAIPFVFSVITEINYVTPKKYYSADRFQEATRWTREHVPENEIVFQGVWDYSLILFYFDDTHRYILGLDPRYMAETFPDDYKIWSAITSGTDKDVRKIADVFHSKTVVIDTLRPSPFEKNLQSSGLFDQVVSNGTVHVYVAK